MTRWRGASGAEATALAVQGNSLVSTYEWAFLFGPGLVVGFGNGLMLGYLMYRSGLVPRRMAMLGLIGGPLADPVLRADPVRCLRERVGTFGPAGTAGDRLGGVARHLLRVEGLPAEPDRRARDGDGGGLEAGTLRSSMSDRLPGGVPLRILAERACTLERAEVPPAAHPRAIAPVRFPRRRTCGRRGPVPVPSRPACGPPPSRPQPVQRCSSATWLRARSS